MLCKSGGYCDANKAVELSLTCGLENVRDAILQRLVDTKDARTMQRVYYPHPYVAEDGEPPLRRPLQVPPGTFIGDTTAERYWESVTYYMITQ